MRNWEHIFQDYFRNKTDQEKDASHDLGHFCRVAKTAKRIAAFEETSDPLILLAAAYFHDIVSLPKNHPEVHLSSKWAAETAKTILNEMQFPSEKIPGVTHAIEAHSFSAGILPETIEAKIIQDADRMEALGALGIARCFYVSGRLGRETYDPNDLFAKRRPLDDKTFALDHFYVKLFKLPSLLQTEGGRKIAAGRAAFLQFFVDELAKNVSCNSGGTLVFIQACYQAGQNHLKIFDDKDPFALKRPLNPKLFALDALISSQKDFPQFTSLFLKQLQEEIEF